ncbi:SLC26A2 [Cordylochernes scorpioides]|uniref:SLC26A2 n=1 Tax=Cordylochernes scorpioides TaxID=51811 RepID=A0ABY6K8F3_9ARAC|nr:SLC26A2 [Cordylochernes scorpioides]
MNVFSTAFHIYQNEDTMYHRKYDQEFMRNPWDCAGMAYGLLASVAAINGLYVSFFPILIYSLMATTRHVSIGTFSIVSIMVASAGDTILPMATGNGTASSAVDLEATDVVQDLHGRMEIFIALAMLTGIIQVLMGSLRLGSLSVVLSDNLVSGFSTGAAIHVTASQIPDLLGVQFPKRQGRFKLLMVGPLYI